MLKVCDFFISEFSELVILTIQLLKFPKFLKLSILYYSSIFARRECQIK